MDSQARVPRRTVHQAEALAWLAAHPAEAHTSVVTSLPDVSEFIEGDFLEWRQWFLGAARAVLTWIPDDAVAVFFQTDILHRGVWIDKSFLVQTAAESSGLKLVWHKIVCRAPSGRASPGRAGYSHLLCLGRKPRPAFRQALPDVLPDAGFEPTRKAMGALACALAVRFVLAETTAQTIIDPFCGQGTALAVANAFGLDAVGVDRSTRACRAARKLKLEMPSPE